MRDETIRPGDMVHAVWGCCVVTREVIGKVLTVVEIREKACTRCTSCGYHHHLVAHVHVVNDELEGVAPRSWFKKIHPDDGERVRNADNLRREKVEA